MRLTLAIGFSAVLLSVGTAPSYTAGDFPMASCKGWNGTIVECDGLDTARASMRGAITKADLQEYCERDPGGETKPNGGRLTMRQCVENYLREEARTTMLAKANCKAGTITYRVGENRARSARIPRGSDADTSCASGMLPLIEQFKLLCPQAARRLKVE